MNERLFKNYGIGVGLRYEHHDQFLDPARYPKSIDWLEVVSENYMDAKDIQNTRSIRLLLQLRKDFPIALHGVSMSIASAGELDFDYLKKLKALIDQVNPIIVSDHLCWTRSHSVQTHDLNPVPYTPELVKHVAQKIRQVQDFLDRRILIENLSSYVTFESSVMNEAEFTREVVEAADCGLLLDINNVYVTATNHQFDPKKYLEIMPHARVGQIHMAGHSNVDGFLIDTHDHEVPEAVWELYRWYGEKYGHPSSMIEWDANIPPWARMEQEILTLRKNFQPEIRFSPTEKIESAVMARKSKYGVADFKVLEAKWARSLLSDYEVEGILNQPPLSAQKRFEVYENAFWLRLDEALEMDFVDFKKLVGDDEWWDLIYASVQANPPQSWTLIDLSEVFVQYLRDQKHPRLSVAELEWARIKAAFLMFAKPDAAIEDFAKLSALKEDEMNRVQLVFHPSLQILREQRAIVWNDSNQGGAKEKILTEVEWNGIVAIDGKLTLSELGPYSENINQWVRDGIVCGWKIGK